MLANKNFVSERARCSKYASGMSVPQIFGFKIDNYMIEEQMKKA